MKKLIIQFQEGKEGAVKRLLTSLKVEVLDENQIVKSDAPPAIDTEALTKALGERDSALLDVAKHTETISTLELEKSNLQTEKAELEAKLAEALAKKEKATKPKNT